MKLERRGLILMGVHLLLVSTLAGRLLLDRHRLPSVWTETAPVDPSLPIRGRYVRLNLRVDGVGFASARPGEYLGHARLDVTDGRLVAVADSSGPVTVRSDWRDSLAIVLAEPVAFFIPEHVPDPSIRPPGETLWAEVTVPTAGPPRPVRLGVARGAGPPEPLDLR